MILLIDNYDSFSYNVFHLIGSVEKDIRVMRNDALSISDIQDMQPDAIVLSPGPKRPEDAGICMDVIRNFYTSILILGICLGYQAICESFGATVTYAKTLMHGKQDQMILDKKDPIFAGLRDFPAARYHSLSVRENTLPDCLEKLAHSSDGEIMAIRHKYYPVYGFQFHPESVMTPCGKQLIQNFKTIIEGENNHD